MPGSHLCFSGSAKGPAIYCAFKVPPACRSDVKGLLADSGSGPCLGLASSLSSGRVYLCQGIYARGKGQQTPSISPCSSRMAFRFIFHAKPEPSESVFISIRQ